MSEIGISSVELSRKIKERNKNSIGKPFLSVEYSIDENSVLTVKGDSLCFKRLHDGKEIYDNGVFVTGDIAERDEKGNYFIKGRIGDTVIGENGENINPDIIEAMFDLKDALNFSVLGIEDTLSMVVQISPYLPLKKREDMRLYIEETNEKLPLLSRIKRVYFTNDSIVAATAIKVSRKYLLREIENGNIKITPFEKCEIIESGEYENTALLKKVTEIIAKVIDEDIEKIEPDTNLLVDLEISSIQYFSILSALAEEFSLIANSDDKYCYTVREMCEYVERQL
jgi:long-subunit acyl-CoA synthetase (AMP-forming)